MRLYIKSDFKKKITFTTRELLWKMWFKEWQGYPITYSNVGDDECIEINFEDAFATDYNEKGDYLRILTTHLEVLTVDKRAMYIMALEIAKVIDGQISEDNKKTWLTVEKFRKKHEAILSLTFEEANERSLNEIQTMDVVDDPLWEEEANRRKEYILAHGGDISDL